MNGVIIRSPYLEAFVVIRDKNEVIFLFISANFSKSYNNFVIICFFSAKMMFLDLDDYCILDVMDLLQPNNIVCMVESSARMIRLLRPHHFPPATSYVPEYRWELYYRWPTHSTR